jgi:multiple sugar transport system substrate-binding protein
MKSRSMHRSGWIAAMALVVSACAGGQSSPSSSAATSPAGSAPATSQAPAEKVTFTLTTWAGEGESKELQELVLDKINSSQSEFEIVHQPAPADYYTKLQTGLAGGTGADFMWLSQEYIAGYASRGALLDLTDLLKSVGKPAADVSKYFPDVIKTAQFQGKVYGLPWIAQPVLLYYNPKLFDAAGIPYPDDSWDWDKLTSTAKALTKDDQYGFTASGWPPIHMFIWQAGGEVITPDLMSSPIDTPEAVKGEDFYKSLIYNKACCPAEDTIAEQGFGEMFKAGKVAMFMGGASDTYEDANGNVLDIRASVVPKGPASRTTFAWTASTVVNANGANVKKNPQLAAKALAALTEGIFGWKLIAPNTDFATADVIKAAIPVKWKQQKEQQIDAILAATKDMRSFNIVPRHQEWDDLFWREFQDPLYHDKGTAADLAKAVRPRLEALLK